MEGRVNIVYEIIFISVASYSICGEGSEGESSEGESSDVVYASP